MIDESSLRSLAALVSAPRFVPIESIGSDQAPKLFEAVMEIANVLTVGMAGCRVAALQQDECRRDDWSAGYEKL